MTDHTSQPDIGRPIHSMEVRGFSTFDDLLLKGIGIAAYYEALEDPEARIHGRGCVTVTNKHAERMADLSVRNTLPALNNYIRNDQHNMPLFTFYPAFGDFPDER